MVLKLGVNRQLWPTNRDTCLLIMRAFKEQIGEGAEQYWLVIIADHQGKLVTVYTQWEEQLRDKMCLVEARRRMTRK